MAEFQLAGLFTEFIHGEVYDPAECILFLVDVVRKSCTEGLNGHTCSLLCLSLRTSCYDNERFLLDTKCGYNLVLLQSYKLCDTTNDLTLLVQTEPVRLRTSLNTNFLDGLVDELSGLMEIRDYNCLHDSTFLVKRSEAEALHQVGCILSSKVDTKIGLVGAVLLECGKVRNTYKGSTGCSVICTILSKDRRKNVLNDSEYIFLGSECHLHIQLVEFSGRTVSTRILITEAGSDLEVAVDTGNHQKLLELLGCLRQCIELTRMLSCGNEVVTCALRRRSGKNGRGNLHEIMCDHRFTQSANNVGTQDDVLLHIRITKIEVSVLETKCLIRLAASVYFKGKLVVTALAENFNLLRNNFDLTGSKLCVLGRSLTNDAFYSDGRFLGDSLEEFHHLLGLSGDLGGSIEIANYDECEVCSNLTHVLEPSGKANGLTRIAQSQFPASMGT